MDKHQQLKEFTLRFPQKVGKVVYFDATQHKLLQLDLSAANTSLTPDIIASAHKLSGWVFKNLKQHKCKYGIGGYFENRTLYNKTPLFNTDAEPRSLHLGIDIWGDGGTTVYSPLAGRVHSFADNANVGDYGPTIILEHDLNGLTLYSLYGHLSQESLLGLHEGLPIEENEKLGELGAPDENGNWPPHLHFQLMFDMEGKKGDYPGACRPSDRSRYRDNIPDPNLILRFPETSIIIPG